MIEIKPCPFCGGEPYFLKPRHEKGTALDTMMIECKHCGALPYGVSVYDGEKEEDKKAAIAKFWNRRSSGWISVNGRVPCETSNKWCVGVNSCGKMFAFKESLACNPKSDTWLIPTALFNAEEITHFMYLPEPPTLEGDE